MSTWDCVRVRASQHVHDVQKPVPKLKEMTGGQLVVEREEDVLDWTGVACPEKMKTGGKQEGKNRLNEIWKKGNHFHSGSTLSAAEKSLIRWKQTDLLVYGFITGAHAERNTPNVNMGSCVRLEMRRG